jgi:hypothetical protein
MPKAKRQEFESAPRSFTKPASRRPLLSKAGTAWEAIGTVKKNTDTYVLTFGQFNLIDVLVVLLDQTGPATVDLSTWTAADAHLNKTAELITSCDITRFRLIVDHSFEGRQPEYVAHMRKIFGPECVRQLRTHAKFMIIRSDSHDIVVRTSMNLNGNPRLENVEISESADFANWMTTIVDQIFGELEPMKNYSNPPVMAEIPDTSPWIEVTAEPIKRKNLNEASATHTLKKL